MNNIINRFLLAENKFMPEIHLRQPEFTYGAYGVFTKNKTRIQIFKATEETRYIYQKQLYKNCFQHDMASGNYKDPPRRTVSDKVLRGTTFVIASNPHYDI